MPTPVVIFAFNRPDAFARLAADLAHCELAAETDVIVFVDGAREGRKGEAEAVAEVVRKAHGMTGMHSVTVHASTENRGLATSVISGVTQVINQYGRVIVLEDDLRLASNFLVYMNQMLDHYEMEQRVFQISGFGLKVRPPRGYEADVYFHIRSASWGWATWSDRWNTVDWEVRDFARLARNPLAQWRFNRGGSDMYGMLRDWHRGRNHSWAIRFSYAMHSQHRLCVTPIQSLTRNEGFGEDATHCNDTNFYHVDMDSGVRRTFRLPETIKETKALSAQASSYFSLWTRFRNGRRLRTVLRWLGLA